MIHFKINFILSIQNILNTKLHYRPNNNISYISYNSERAISITATNTCIILDATPQIENYCLLTDTFRCSIDEILHTFILLKYKTVHTYSQSITILKH